MHTTRRLRLSLVTSAVLLSLPATMLTSSAAASASLNVPVITLTTDAADINTSQVLDGATENATETPGSQFLTFGHQQAPTTLTNGTASASAASSQSAALSTPTALPLPVSPLDDISVDAAATSRATATATSSTAPVATANGTLSAQFTTSGSVPVFFTGTEQTSNTDATDSCSHASVVLTGPVSRSFAASSGHCKEVNPGHQQWAQSITLPAGSYSVDVDYSTQVDDNVTNGEPTSVLAFATLSANLSFLPPSAQFTTTPSGFSASFNGAAAFAGLSGRPVISWHWQFGDGTAAVTTQPRITHIFPASPRRAPTYRVTLQVLDTAHALSPPVSHTVLGTATTLAVTKTALRLVTSGVVGPNRQGRSVVVTLARKVNGSFHVLATHRPPLSSRSRFATTFRRPARGTCRVVARYPGDATHLASTTQRIVSC